MGNVGFICLLSRRRLWGCLTLWPYCKPLNREKFRITSDLFIISRRSIRHTIWAIILLICHMFLNYLTFSKRLKELLEGSNTPIKLAILCKFTFGEVLCKLRETHLWFCPPYVLILDTWIYLVPEQRIDYLLDPKAGTPLIYLLLIAINKVLQ